MKRTDTVACSAAGRRKIGDFDIELPIVIKKRLHQKEQPFFLTDVLAWSAHRVLARGGPLDGAGHFKRALRAHGHFRPLANHGGDVVVEVAHRL